MDIHLKFIKIFEFFSFKKDSSLVYSIILLLPVVINLFLYYYWQEHSYNPITGDEPHYLIVTDSIVSDLDLEVSNNYLKHPATSEINNIISNPLKSKVSAKEFSERINSQKGIWEHWHTNPNGFRENGTYSIRSPALPIILSIPYAIGGISGAEITMLILASLLPFIMFRVLYYITKKLWLSTWFSVALGIGMPLASSQRMIYPDLCVGFISLINVFLLLLLNDKKNWSWFQFLTFTILTFILPWFHMKHLVLMCFFICAYFICSFPNFWKKELNLAYVQFLFILLVAGCSMYAFISYNLYAFGNWNGSWKTEAVELSNSMSFTFMHFMKFFIDQRQGIFMQNFNYSIALLGMGVFFKEKRTLFIISFLIYVGMIGIHALVGANSFPSATVVGRASWNCFPLLVFPIAYLLKNATAKMIFWLCAFTAVGAMYQIYVITCILTINGMLYLYSLLSFYPHIYPLLPSFDDENTYLLWIPNYIFLFFMSLTILYGFRHAYHKTLKLKIGF